MKDCVPQRAAIPRNEMKGLSEGKYRLIEFLDGLDSTGRHFVVVVCRGREPWRFMKLASGKGMHLNPDLDALIRGEIV